MTEYDLFDLTGLSFDPPEKAVKRIKVAIKKAKDNLKSMLGDKRQQAEPDEVIRNKLNYLDLLEKDIFTSDGKLSADYERLAEQHRQSALDRLEGIIRLEKLGKKELAITSSKIKALKKNTRLSEDSIKALYHQHGFRLVDMTSSVSISKLWPRNWENWERAHNKISVLRGSHDPNPNGADLTRVYNLYDFAAYICGEPENGQEYRSVPTKEICTLFDEYCLKTTMIQDDLTKLCNAIATAGKKFVFDSESDRKAYELFLLYKSPELAELFSTIKAALKSDLRDPLVADICVRKITEVFGNSDIALAIYNHVAGLKDDEAYMPERASFEIKCDRCGGISEFTTYDEAKRTNRCSFCGKALFKQCNSCGKIIMFSADRCPECGFVFANIGLFTKYISIAEMALRKGDLNEAKNYYIRAKGADPSQTARLTTLERQLQEEENKIAVPLNKLKTLMAQKKYESARLYLGELITKFPQLDLREHQRIINDVLSHCRNQYTNAQSSNHVARIDACVDILEHCIDYRAAIDYLNANPPAACESLVVMQDGLKRCISLRWSPSKERGVTYTVLRKQGSRPSLSVIDGKIIIENTNQTSYIDNDIEAGIQYCYTVFATRMGSVSRGVYKSVQLLEPVFDVRHWQQGKTIKLTWRLPNNCQSAMVNYKLSGQEYRLANASHESVVLTNIHYGEVYTFAITANYGIYGVSVPIHISVTPTPIVESFQISAKQGKDGNYNVAWNIREQGVDVQILVNGRVVHNTRSEQKNCTLTLPKNNHYTVSVQAFSGGKWIPSSNELILNTYPSVKIDEEKTTISESYTANSVRSGTVVEIKIRLKNDYAGDIVAFYCFVRTKISDSDPAPWATEQDTRTGIDRIEFDSYQEWGEITKRIPSKNANAFYVTLYSVYRVNGQEILSAPCKKKLVLPLDGNLLWRVNKPLWGTPTLDFELSSNRPIGKRPRILLCYSPEGKNLLGPNDYSAVRIAGIRERVLDPPRRNISETYNISLPANCKNGKFFLFIMDPYASEKFTARWMTGFNGRV